MKLIKTANGKQNIQISQLDWEKIGTKGGWLKEAKDMGNKPEYSWCFIDLPKHVKDKLKDIWSKIDENDLFAEEADDGIEKDPHITVKYGLKTNEAKDIRSILKGCKGGFATLTSSDIFECEEYDVLKISVKSADLSKLNTELNRLPHDDKHPVYHAHATLAYLKRGAGKKYVGKFNLNETFEFDAIYFGDLDNQNHKVKLIS
jgi:2'-5' RNA ligase